MYYKDQQPLIFIGSIGPRRIDLITFYLVLLFLSFTFNLTSMFFFSGDISYRGNFIPLQISLFFSLVCSLYLNKGIIKYLILIILFECCCGYIQSMLGVQSFFSGVSTSDNASKLLYYNRVYGLSKNSSGLAGNALVALVLFEFIFANKVKLIFKLTFYSLIFLVLVVSFSRSGIVAFTVYIMLKNFNNFISLKNFKFFFILLFIAVLALMFFDFTPILEQFTRGRGEVEVSGRDIIWMQYIDVAFNNLVFGNYGFRNYLNFDLYGEMHAHNSYLMTLYIMGGVSCILFYIFIIYRLISNRKILLLVTPILVYSFAQYFVFWGASLADIVLFYLLFSFTELKNKNTNNLLIR